MRIKTFCCAGLLLLLTGCSQHTVTQPQPAVKTNVPANESTHIEKKILNQHQEWQGTPYKLGGISKRGVDCSGLMAITFKQQFAMSMPRTTAGLVNQGTQIKRKNLRAGDLVFFKTGIKVRHVGVMVDEQRFFHASTSRGVMISRLDNVYWNRHYWQSRRVNL